MEILKKKIWKLARDRRSMIILVVTRKTRAVGGTIFPKSSLEPSLMPMGLAIAWQDSQSGWDSTMPVHGRRSLQLPEKTMVAQMAV
jgi:hypothetical protein